MTYNSKEEGNDTSKRQDGSQAKDPPARREDKTSQIKECKYAGVSLQVHDREFYSHKTKITGNINTPAIFKSLARLSLTRVSRRSNAQICQITGQKYHVSRKSSTCIILPNYYSNLPKMPNKRTIWKCS